MSALRTAAQQALEALGHVVRQAQENLVPTIHYGPVHDVMNNLRSALAQEQAEPVAGIIEPRIEEDSHQTLDDAMRLPRAMAQAYERGYKAGQAHERERIIQFLQEMQRVVGDAHNHYGVAAVRIKEGV